MTLDPTKNTKPTPEMLDVYLDPTKTENPAIEILEVYATKTPGNVAPQFSFLSPELLMEFVEQELHSTDQKILNEMQSIKKDKALAEELSNLGADATGMAESGGVSQGALVGGVITLSYQGKTYTYPNTPQGLKDADAKEMLLQQDYANTGGTDSLGTPYPAPNRDDAGAPVGDVAKASQMVNDLEAMAEKAAASNQTDLAADCQALAQKIRDGGAVSKGELEALAHKCEAAATSLTSSADMTMIRLQQLVQDRSRLITMITNVLKAMDEPKDQAVRNMG